MRWRRRAKWLFVAGIILVICACVILIWLHSMDSHATFSPSPNSAQEEIIDDDGFAEVDWEHWRQINPDIKAWVSVDDTNIDYPVLRSPSQDPTFYLHHDIYGNYSVYGIPYFDSSCVVGDPSVFNTIIFGHHMDNGTMFSDFANYCDEEYAREHAIVHLQTPTKKMKLAVAFVNVVDGNSDEKVIHFSNPELFRAWYSEQREKACVILDGETLPESVFTFCTCSYNHFSNERTLVICYELEE